MSSQGGGAKQRLELLPPCPAGPCVLQVFEFSLLQKEYTQWSRALLKHGLHRLWLQRDTPITHISFSRSSAAQLLLHDAFMLCVIDQTLPFPEPAAMLSNQLSLRSLPEAERSRFSHAFKICKTFQVFQAPRSRQTSGGCR